MAEPIDLSDEEQNAARKQAGGGEGLRSRIKRTVKRILGGARETVRAGRNKKQASKAGPFRPGLGTGAALGLPAVVETGRAIGDVSRARDEGVPVSRGLAFRRNLEAIPGALIDAGATLAGTAIGGPAAGLATAATVSSGRRSLSHNIDVGLDRVFGTDLSTQDYSAAGQIEAARQDHRRARDLAIAREELPKTGLQTLDDAIEDSTQSGNTSLAPAPSEVRPAGPSPTFADGTPRNLARDPNDPRVGALNYTLDRARVVGEQNRARKDRLADATIQTANVKTASERRAVQTAIDTKRRNAQSDLDGQVKTLFPDENERAGFTQFLAAMNPASLVDKGLLTPEQAEGGKDFAELLVDLRVRDPGTANKVLNEILPQFELFKNVQGGSGQGLGKITGIGVPGLLDSFSDPNGVSPGTALGARLRAINPFGGGSGEFINLEGGGQIDVRDTRGQGKGGRHVARGLRKAREERALLDAEGSRELAIANAKRFGLR